MAAQQEVPRRFMSAYFAVPAEDRNPFANHHQEYVLQSQLDEASVPVEPLAFDFVILREDGEVQKKGFKRLHLVFLNRCTRQKFRVEALNQKLFLQEKIQRHHFIFP